MMSRREDSCHAELLEAVRSTTENFWRQRTAEEADGRIHKLHDSFEQTRSLELRSHTIFAITCGSEIFMDRRRDLIIADRLLLI